MPGGVLPAGLAHEPGVHEESGPTQELGHTLGFQPVDVERQCMAVRVVQMPDLVPGLEGQQQMAARGQHPVEFGEHLGQQLGRGVDDGVPGDDAAETAVVQVEGIHRTHVEAQIRVRLTVHRDATGRCRVRSGPGTADVPSPARDRGRCRRPVRHRWPVRVRRTRRASPGSAACVRVPFARARRGRPRRCVERQGGTYVGGFGRD